MEEKEKVDKVKSYDEIRRILKQKFGTIFLFFNKILNSRILTNILLIIVISKLAYIGHRCGCHCVSSYVITDAVEEALKNVFYRY